MKTKRTTMKLACAMAATCLAVACLSLAACGTQSQPAGGAQGSSADTSAAAVTDTSAAAAPDTSAAAAPDTSAAPAPAPAGAAGDVFSGTWKIAAFEQNGVTMSGNFSALAGDEASSDGEMTFAADGTGTLTMNGEPMPFTWAAETAELAYVTPVSEDGAATQVAWPVAFDGEALVMAMDMDDQQATVFFTRDGNYSGAKQITLDGATPITSEAELLGDWRMVGLNMGGVSMYGDAESLAAASPSMDTKITFAEGGVLKTDSQESTWAVDGNGATATMQGMSGPEAYPIVKIGDKIAIDMSGVLEGLEFIAVYAK